MLVACLLALVAGSSHAASSSRDQVALDNLARAYFKAVAEESLPDVASCFWFRSDADRQARLRAFEAAFKFADTRIDEVDVLNKNVGQDTAVINLRVKGALVQPDLKASTPKESHFTIIAERDQARWKIAKVMRKADYDNARRVAILSTQFTDEPSVDVPGPKPEPRPGPIPGSPPGAAENLPFEDDFSRGAARWEWDRQAFDVTLEDGRLFWNDPRHLPLTSRISVPLEDIVIEYDAWCEGDGLPLRWYNDRKEGYCVVPGAWNNTRSATEYGRYLANRAWLMGKHIELGKWQHYKIVRFGGKLEVYVDRQLVISRDVPGRIEGSGPIRFYSYSRVGIDNVRVRRADPRNVLP